MGSSVGTSEAQAWLGSLHQWPCCVAAVLHSSKETQVSQRFCKNRGSMLAREPLVLLSPRRMVLFIGRRARETMRGLDSTATLLLMASKSLSNTVLELMDSGFLEETTSQVEARTLPRLLLTAMVPPRIMSMSTMKTLCLNPPLSTPMTPPTRSLL